MAIKCSACDGTGDMPPGQVEDHYSVSRDPVCIQWGCQKCQGHGEIESDED